nr:filaggrin-2 [Helicoverpa armigera]
MERFVILALWAFVVTCLHYTSAEETVLSEVLTPKTEEQTDKLKRQSRSYYDYRYGAPRPIYDRLEYGRQEYDRPRCGRCDDRRDDDDDYDRRDRYDDDRRGHKPTYGNRHDNKKNYDSDEDRYSDRKGGNKNGTDEDNGDGKNAYDDKDSRPSGSRRGSDRDRDRDRGRDRDRDRRRGGDRYDDRERYRPDYYDRFLRDPYRERDYYDDYRGRRPLYDRYYPSYDDGLSRYDGYGYSGVRRPAYDDRGYDDGYGGYGPSAGRGPHDSFRPWDETYRGQAGWDAGGRGYYFASGRPDAAPAAGWGRPEYARPQDTGYQSAGYSGYAGSYRDPYAQGSSGYTASAGYGQGAGYAQPSAAYGQAAAYGQSFAGYGQSSGYGQGSGWHSVGERRPYRDESSVKKLENRDNYNQETGRNQNSFDQSSRQPASYGQTSNYGQSYQQVYGSSSTTPGTSYLFQREDDQVTVKDVETTKPPS